MPSPQNISHLIVGLGNPGPEFANTYHNVGFLALDAIEASYPDESLPWKTHRKIFSYAEVGSLILVKPLTFMNESGIAAKEALKKFNAPWEGLSVIHDESDLTIGELKVSNGKNAAGHRGVQSIIDHIGTNEFERFRIGIRPVTENIRKKASAFVLTRIAQQDHEALDEVFAKIVKELKIPNS